LLLVRKSQIKNVHWYLNLSILSLNSQRK